MALPTPTPITPATRFYDKGTTEFWFVPTISNKAAPSSAECTAGTDLTGDVNTWDGWAISSDTVDTPDLASRFTSQIDGDITAASSSITMYRDQASSDVRGLLPRGTVGFICIPWDGSADGNLMDVFPVKVTGTPKTSGITDPGLLMVQFAITSEPAEDVPIPTA